jgi:hypothetical protein
VVEPSAKEFASAMERLLDDPGLLAVLRAGAAEASRDPQGREAWLAIFAMG